MQFHTHCRLYSNVAVINFYNTKLNLFYLKYIPAAMGIKRPAFGERGCNSWGRVQRAGRMRRRR